jgi:hypothetical protein
MRILLSTIAAAVSILVMVVVELVFTIVLYIYLNLYHLETFGYLVRLASSILQVLTEQLEYWMPMSANAAYATLIGELGPKSILLLMLGLVTGAVIRAFARLFARLLMWRSSSAQPQHS